MIYRAIEWSRETSRRTTAVGIVLLLSMTVPIGTGLAWDDRAPETISVSQTGGLDPAIEGAASGVASQFGGSVTIVHSGTLQLLGVTRGSNVVQAAAPGWRYPMASSAIDPRQAAALLKPEVASVLSSGNLVMARTSAELRGARAGDEIEILGWDDEIHHLRIGAVVEDDRIGGSELLLSTETAAVLEMVRPSQAVLWGVEDPEEVRAVLELRLPDEAPIRVRLETDDPDPDRVLSTASIKRRFGEFAYRPSAGDAVRVDPTWEAENIVTMTLPLLGSFKCHRLLAPYLSGAIADLQETGLIYQLDPDDFQRNGGCYNAREIRGGDKGGALSRHAWGAAIDLNPTRNQYGGQVAMNRTIVETFRKWGFAWGGGWIYPDGAHFEWTRLPEFLQDP